MSGEVIHSFSDNQVRQVEVIPQNNEVPVGGIEESHQEAYRI
jgi:hypothetical protein